MKDAPPELTLEEVRARMKAVGVHIDETRLEMVRVLLRDALAPVRAMDPRALNMLEPAIRFDPGSPQPR